jgi:hypothetical protein
VILTAWGVDSNGGGGYEEEVFDDVDSGIAVECGTQDPTYVCNHIIDGTMMAEDIVHHKRGVMYRYKDPSGKVTRTKPDKLLSLPFLRKEIRLELTGKLHNPNFDD